jgi:hypothetical protein
MNMAMNHRTVLPSHWNATTLNDEQLFAFESGIWTLKSGHI